MSAATNIDAYAQWLGIPPHEQPPHHYRLLGVALFESDPQAILAAAQRQTALVSVHLSGAASDCARRILAELAAAQACLLDPRQKAAYDRTLTERARVRGAAAGEPPPVSAGPADRAAMVFHRPTPRSKAHASPAPAAAAGAVAGAAQNGEDAHLPFHEPAPAPAALPWMLGGVCAGLLGVVVLGLVLFSGDGRSQPARPTAQGTDQANNTSPASARANGARRPDVNPPPDSAALPRLPRDAAPGTRRLGPPPTGATDLRWDPSEPDSDPLAEISDPEPASGERSTATAATTDSGLGAGSGAPSTAKTPEVPAVRNRLAGLPKYAPLPRLLKAGSASGAPSGPVVLARLELAGDDEVRLNLVQGKLPGGAGTFNLQPVETAPADADSPTAAGQTWQVQYSAEGLAPQAVAEYSLADGELSFRWLEGAAESAAPLDAAALDALRNLPLEIAAGEHRATLAQREPRTIPPLAVRLDKTMALSAAIDKPPQDARVFLEVEELAAPFPESSWPTGKVIREGKEGRVVFGDGSQPFQMSLHFSFEREDDNRVRIEVHPMIRETTSQKWDYFSPAKGAEALAQLKQREQALDAALAQLQQQFRRNPALYQQAAAENNRQAAVLQKAVASLEKINTQWQAVHQSGTIGFRVFANSAGQEIDLLQTEAAPPEAAPPPAPPRDPNVGAPIAPGAAPAADEPEPSAR